jgi:hypothetical protein
MLNLLWNYKIQLVPVLIAFGIFEMLCWLRRITKLHYIPLYFVCPFDSVNKAMAEYYGDDHFVGKGFSLSEEDGDRIRIEIRNKAILAYGFAGFIIPLVAGFAMAFFLPMSCMVPTLILICAYKTKGIMISFYFYVRNHVSTKRGALSYIFVYAVYLGVLCEMMRTAYYWAKPFVDKSDWSALAASFSALIFAKLLGGLFLSIALPLVFTEGVFNPKLRKSILNELGKERRMSKREKNIAEARKKLGNIMLNPPGPIAAQQRSSFSTASSPTSERVDKNIVEVGQKR